MNKILGYGRVALSTLLFVLLTLAAADYLRTPARAQFSQMGAYAGVSTGTANAQIISLPNVGAWSDLNGVVVTFIPGSGLTNTGPATLQNTTCSGCATLSLYRVAGGTQVQLGGAELQAGLPTQVLVSCGPSFPTCSSPTLTVLNDWTGGAPVGSLKAVDATTADPGYLLAYGQCVSETTYAALYAKIGTTHNTADSCSGSNFGLPDLRERYPAGLGNMGGTDPGRITSAVSGFNPTTLGAAGGVEGVVGGITKAELASFTMTGTQSGAVVGNNGGDVQGGLTFPNSVVGDLSVNVSVSSGGSGATVPTLSPVQMFAYEIKL